MRVTSCERRVSCCELRVSRAWRRAPRAFRGGISLLEVLISMFVLLFGLMGVAAIFPVGNHYAGRGEQFDRAAAVTSAAFAEIKARKMLRPAGDGGVTPSAWNYGPNPNGKVSDTENGEADVIGEPVPNRFQFNFTWPPAADEPGPGYAWVLDPLGVAAGLDPQLPTASQAKATDVFPFSLFDAQNPNGVASNDPLTPTNYLNPWQSSGTQAQPGELLGNRWPIRRITFYQAHQRFPMNRSVAETIFRLRDDLAVELPTQGDRPAQQRWRSADINPSNGNANNTPNDPTDDMPLARDFAGHYSWLATIVPGSVGGVSALQPSHPQYGAETYEVSVVVFYKRDPFPSADSERSINAVINPGGELVLYAANNNYEAVDAATKGFRAGQWIAVAGTHPTAYAQNPRTGQFILRWYKLLSLDEETTTGSSPDGQSSGSFAIRRATIEGKDWPLVDTDGDGVDNSATALRAILLPGVIDVTTQPFRIGRDEAAWD